MGTHGSSETTAHQSSYLVAAPKDYFLGPVFAATKQVGQREVVVADKRYLIGGFHPLRADYRPPALDVRHARAIFTLLSFRDRDDETKKREIRFSFYEFCRRYANSNGGRYVRDIKNILGEIVDSFIQVTDLKTKLAHSYRIIERVVIADRAIKRKDAHDATSNQTELRLNACTLSPEFYGLLENIVELRHLNLRVFTSIRSPLAQAIYLYIPSRAYHHTEEDPFEITVTRLLEQVSFTVHRFKSKRKELFTKHAEENRSILQQLDGVETRQGRFRVRLVETANGADWKIQSWVEHDEKLSKLKPETSKLLAAWLKSGRSREAFELALDYIQPLNDYEIDLLEQAGVEIPKNRRFFEMAKTLLGDALFDTLAAEAKNDAKEGRKAKKNPTAKLIHRIMESIAAPIKR